MILPSSCSFASTFSHFLTLPQHMLSLNCSVLCFRSLTKCSHCIKTHDTVTLLTANKSIREVLSTAANTDGSFNVANSLAQYLDFFLCASSTIFPDRIFAHVLIASSRFQSFAAPVSNRYLMCSARLFAMLSSVLVEGFCTALTLLTRRHDNFIRFGPLLLLLISTSSLEVSLSIAQRFQSSWTIGTGSSIISSLVSRIVPSRCLFTSTSLSSSIDRSGLVIFALTLSSAMPSICSFCAARSCSSAKCSVSVSPDSPDGHRCRQHSQKLGLRQP